MKPIKPVLLATAALISLLSIISAPSHAVQNAANFTGDITLKRDTNGLNTGIHFSDTTYQNSASPWSYSNLDIYFNKVGANVGIGGSPAVGNKLDVFGTVNAFRFTGDGSGLSSLWSTKGNSGTSPDTNFIGTTDNSALEFRVNNSRAFRIDPTATSPNIAAGHPANTAGGAVVYGATVSGGGHAGTNCIDPDNYLSPTRSCVNMATNVFATVSGGNSNVASGDSSTVGGGDSNTASGYKSTVGGGYGNSASGGTVGTVSFFSEGSTVGGGAHNTASNNSSTVAGGKYNMASGHYSTVGGGDQNVASGDWSTVGGGYLNSASGHYSWAGGRRAQAHSAGTNPTNHYGTFVWADSSNNGFLGHDFYSTANDEFSVRATGGVRFVTLINTSTGDPTRTFAINSNGDVSIDPSGALKFGSTTRQMINLWGDVYAIGVQNNTGYFRTDGEFAWYRKGAHSNNAADPGGGTTLMRLAAGKLSLPDNGAVIELGADVAGKQADAGKISYQKFSVDSLDIVGAGTNDKNRKIAFFNEGGANFTGQATFAGNVTAWNFPGASSRRLKTKIQTIEGALDKVTRLRGVSYDWKSDGRHDIGVIAEEVAQVVPEVVYYEDNGIDTKGVDYGHLVGLLIEAVKTQKAENDVLKARLEQIEQLLDSK
jgi:hypothetical protein